MPPQSKNCEFEDSVAVLVSFFASNPTEWKKTLPSANPSVVYRAPGTPLTSIDPLFAVSYELWSLLNYADLDGTDTRHDALAQLRIVLQILWDVGAVRHVDWNVGNADRWDDYWRLLNRLAADACASLGWSPLRQDSFKLESYLFAVCADSQHE